MKRLFVLFFIFSAVIAIFDYGYKKNEKQILSNIAQNKITVLSKKYGYLDSLKTKYSSANWISEIKLINNYDLADSLAFEAVSNGLINYNELPSSLIIKINKNYKNQFIETHNFDYKNHFYWLNQLTFFNKLFIFINATLGLMLFFTCLAISKSLICHNNFKAIALQKSGLHYSYNKAVLAVKTVLVSLSAITFAFYLLHYKIGFNNNIIILAIAQLVVLKLAFLIAYLIKD